MKEITAWQNVCDIISFLAEFMIHNHYVITRRFRPTMRFCFAPASFAVAIYRQVWQFKLLFCPREPQKGEAPKRGRSRNHPERARTILRWDKCRDAASRRADPCPPASAGALGPSRLAICPPRGPVAKDGGEEVPVLSRFVHQPSTCLVSASRPSERVKWNIRDEFISDIVDFCLGRVPGEGEDIEFFLPRHDKNKSFCIHDTMIKWMERRVFIYFF